jgi:hypothetical protein
MTQPVEKPKSRDPRSWHPNYEKRMRRAAAQLNRKAKPSTGVHTDIWEWLRMGAKPMEIRARLTKGSKPGETMLLSSVREIWSGIFKKKG